MCGSNRVDLLYFRYYAYLGVNSIVVSTSVTTGYRHFVLVDAEGMIGYRHLCINGHQTNHRTNSRIQWTNLTVN